MEIKVGMQHVQREIVVETDENVASIERRLNEAVESGGLLRLTDVKGRAVLIPASVIAYIDLGAEHARAVGFGVV